MCDKPSERELYVLAQMSGYNRAVLCARIEERYKVSRERAELWAIETLAELDWIHAA